MYEALLDADDKLEISEDLLKSCGFEISINEFVTTISTNEVLREIFQMTLTTALQISLLPSNMERFMAKRKIVRRRKV